MQNSHEHIILGYINSNKKRHMDHFNFDNNDSRLTVVKFRVPAGDELIRKSSTSKILLNPCQKPLSLMKWIVRHFSKPKDYVLDLCAGTGMFTFWNCDFVF